MTDCSEALKPVIPSSEGPLAGRWQRDATGDEELVFERLGEGAREENAAVPHRIVDEPQIAGDQDRTRNSVQEPPEMGISFPGAPGRRLGLDDRSVCGDQSKNVDLRRRESMPPADPRPQEDVPILGQQIDGEQKSKPSCQHAIEDSDRRRRRVCRQNAAHDHVGVDHGRRRLHRRRRCAFVSSTASRIASVSVIAERAEPAPRGPRPGSSS